MASFFQPDSSSDPAIVACGDGDSIKIYCNSILPAEERLHKWYHLLNLSLAIFALGFPLAWWLVRLVHFLWRRFRSRPKQTVHSEVDEYHHRHFPELTRFKAAKSFFFCRDEHELETSRPHDCDVLMVPVAAWSGRGTISKLVAPENFVDSKPNKIVLPWIESTSIPCHGVDDDGPGFSWLPGKETSRSQGGDSGWRPPRLPSYSGIVVRFSGSYSPGHVTAVMRKLRETRLPILVMAHHDSALWGGGLQFGSLAGFIIENALILKNGDRRDYFGSDNLRRIMAKSADERVCRREFFVGCLDLWDRRPAAAVVRRAAKLGEHYGAVVEHGPLRLDLSRAEMHNASKSISGFEHLRRSENTELQKCWSGEKRTPFIPGAMPEAEIAPLTLSLLESAMPDIRAWLRPTELPYPLKELFFEEPDLVEPPDYVNHVTRRGSLWDRTSDGEDLSTQGSFPVTANLTRDQYDAVVRTQTHLRDLELLQPLAGQDFQRVLEELRAFMHISDHRYHVEALVQSLASGHARIYRGLDTGFALPGAEAYFWGVSEARDPSSPCSADIFISRSAPSDVSTILHTWLGYFGVPRVKRYEEELKLERLTADKEAPILLPASITAAVKRATTSEILFLLQQIRVSNLTHQFRNPLIATCKEVLIGDTSRIRWQQAHSERHLCGAVTIMDLVHMRYSEYVRRGAKHLPSLANMAELIRTVERLVQEALYGGDRATLDIMTDALLQSYDPWKSWTDCDHVDINADIFGLVYFCVLRKSALEDVFLEATDRCALFAPQQPDQAAVFAELWVLGSQCEIYFGILPRDLGDIIYNRRRAQLRRNPPRAGARREKTLMTMYSSTDPSENAGFEERREPLSASAALHKKVARLRNQFAEFGALSIFCLPAIIDVSLLTFLGRGLFMTAFMDPSDLGYTQAAVNAILISLLITAGVTGWVGSTGNYYLPHYAYDNMIHFHVQRLSGGFVITVFVALCGLIVLTVTRSIWSGLVFAVYLVAITTYFNLLGIMATMHQQDSPLTSGRTVLWRTMPVLLISPILSSLSSTHDLYIYPPVMYLFLCLILYQYRKLCHEWSSWTGKIPEVTEKDVQDWYLRHGSRESLTGDASGNELKSDNKAALRNFSMATGTVRHAEVVPSINADNDLVNRTARGIEYARWVLAKHCRENEQEAPEAFTTRWFTQLSEALTRQRQLVRGLKEHDVLMLFRFARYDLGSNLGLFLVALMDRWVSIVMSGRQPHAVLFTDSRSRYGFCLCLLYFCSAVMLLDATLQNYWAHRYKLSEEKLADVKHAKATVRRWETHRREILFEALAKLLCKLLAAFGGTTMLMWILVSNPETIIMYYAYVCGYTCVVLFQFNRCFTTNTRAHVAAIFASAVTGFIVGIVLHAVPATAGFMYNDVIAMNTAAILAVILTSLWSLKDFQTPFSTTETTMSKKGDGDNMWMQRKITAESDVDISVPKSMPGTDVTVDDGSYVSNRISELLQNGVDRVSPTTRAAPSSRVSTKLIDLVGKMWRARKLRITVSSEQAFRQAAIGDLCSFSRLERDDVLHVFFGLLGETEARLESWQPLVANILAEAVFYHVARSRLRLGHDKAVQVEHVLGEMNLTVPRRVHLEIAVQDDDTLSRVQLRTNAELMKHLCLGINVDAKWAELPESIRTAVVCRIMGDRVPVGREMHHWMKGQSVELHNVDFHVNLCLGIARASQETRRTITDGSGQRYNRYLGPAEPEPIKQRANHAATTAITVSAVPRSSSRGGGAFWTIRRLAMDLPTAWVKWIAVISGGGSNIERELWYCLRGVYGRTFLLYIFLHIWRICWIMRHFWITILLTYQRPALVNISRLARKGASRKIIGNAIVVELPRKVVTGIASKGETGTTVLKVYEGRIANTTTTTTTTTTTNSAASPPDEKQPLWQATYNESFQIQSRQGLAADGTTSFNSTYYYAQREGQRRPMFKDETRPGGSKLVGYYDRHGRIVHGTRTINGREFAFKYFYKSTSKGNSDVLQADFRVAGDESGDRLSVFWGVPVWSSGGEYTWVPSERVSRIVRQIGAKVYISTGDYQHRRDPLITTTSQNDGVRTVVANAPQVFQEEADLLVRPSNTSFDYDDILIYHRVGLLNRMRHEGKAHALSFLNPLAWTGRWGWTVYRSVPTWYIRTELWNDWLAGNLDAVTASWIDEQILREEPLLRPYWKARSCGRLREAKQVLDASIDQIISAIEIASEVSEICLLPIKTADLYSMGLNRDANHVTYRPQDCYKDTYHRISVIFNDIGCWPESPGGVSNCRRDLVNGHTTIRNHVLAESANDYGIPRFQIEKNVQSIKLLPLWGLERRTANHGLLDNLLQSEVDEKIRATKIQRDIVGYFIPLLKRFIKGARTTRLTRKDLVGYSNVILSLSKYFEHKDYNFTWDSIEVEKAWVEAWLVPYRDDPNVLDPSANFEVERPSMTDFRDALAIFRAYFFIFSVQIPDVEAQCPRVFQSTHHGISSLFGMILKYRRGVNFGIWDHAILWRESCLNISPAQSTLSIPVQSMLLSTIGLATRLAYFHADVVIPCTPLFNPIWETDIGTDRGQLCSKNLFNRKIDPIVNGINNIESFTPINSTRSEKPTVVMLSNIQFIKGIKTAILAAQVIVNEYGFKDYQLRIYGAKDRQPPYTLEMQTLIENLNLSDNVHLEGFGKPTEVLKDAWLFLNSSISEGLPLAIGEAALAGVPIVATEVGATALVLTDPQDANERYGEVVPPNSPVSLARAQLSILSMVGHWTKFTSCYPDDHDDDVMPALPDTIGPSEVEWLTRRMHERGEDRRKLGLLSRSVVLRSFHGNRYLREHEQMYWIQWHMARMNRDVALQERASSCMRFGAPKPLKLAIEGDLESDFRTSVEEKEHQVNNNGGSSHNSHLYTPGTGGWQEYGEKPARERNVLKKKSRPPTVVISSRVSMRTDIV